MTGQAQGFVGRSDFDLLMHSVAAFKGPGETKRPTCWKAFRLPRVVGVEPRMDKMAPPSGREDGLRKAAAAAAEEGKEPGKESPY